MSLFCGQVSGDSLRLTRVYARVRGMRIYLRTFSYLRPYMWHFLGAILLVLLFGAASIFFLPLSRDLFNAFSSRDFGKITNQVLNTIGLFGLRIFFQYSQLYVMTSISNLVLIDIRQSLYVRFQSLPQSFYSDWKMGDILTRLFSDTDRIKDSLVQTFSELLPQLVTFLGVMVYMFILSWKLTLFSLIAVPLFVGIIAFSSGRLKRNSVQIQKKAADITHIAQETLGNMKAVQANTMERYEADRFREENMRSYRSTMAGVVIRVKSEPFISFLQFAVMGLVLWYGGYEVSTGHMTGAELFSFFSGILLLIDPTLALSKAYNNLQQGLVSTGRAFEILDYPNPIRSSENPVIPDQIHGEVTFDHVGFWYGGQDRKALQDFNLSVKAGEVIALVGPSGAGKSTLVHLIPRFYDVSAGTILIDGVPIQSMDLHTLRSNIGIVPQEDVLFRGTVLDNVRYGRFTASDAEVIEALHLANAWEFVETLPGGIYSRIGDRGRKLSGGQKQRLSIARAILRNPKILILDEATSALDSKSEQLVQDALKRLMQNRTTFVIAHRLSTITHANRIVVLEHGEIKEVGSHSALIAQDGAYAKLYALQFQKQAT